MNNDKLVSKYLSAILDQQIAESELELFFLNLFGIKEENHDEFITVSGSG